MKNKKKIKKQKNEKVVIREKGITIISLVVTVIILLILAGVAIRSITGDNGLISRTKQTVEESKKAEYREGIDTVGLGVKLKTAKEHLTTPEYIEEYYQELLKEKENQGSIFKDSSIKKKNDETIRVETKEGYIYYVREDETIYVGKVGEIDEGNIQELKQADIIFSYSHETWTNENVEVTISLSETVANKENYRLEYSKDNRSWTRYTEGSSITMTQNGKVYARVKDITGDIKTEGGYAEGEVTIIDKEAPTAGKLVMEKGSLQTPYISDTRTYQKVHISLQEGSDKLSPIKSNTYSITGAVAVNNQTEDMTLNLSNEKYYITVTTEDSAGNTSQNTYIVNTNYAEDTTEIIQADGYYYIPEGFKLAEDSANQISEGIVVEDKQENEWVWVPCYVEGGKGSSTEEIANGAIQYDRYIFTRTGWAYNQTKLTSKDSDGSYKIIHNNDKSYYFHEGLPVTGAEYLSIKQYGGYYIGRYEAGGESASITKALIQKGKVAYTNITYAQSKELSENMTSSDGTDIDKLDGRKVFTRLCSSYSWDTTLKFIENIHHNYSTTTQTKDGILAGNYSGDIYPTGMTIAVCNIYDMGGNVDEYTTEICTSGGFSHRGCSYNNTLPAGQIPGHRTMTDRLSYYTIGFRPTLFIKSND